jgi:hypothetical protein
LLNAFEGKSFVDPNRLPVIPEAVEVAEFVRVRAAVPVRQPRRHIGDFELLHVCQDAVLEAGGPPWEFVDGEVLAMDSLERVLPTETNLLVAVKTEKALICFRTINKTILWAESDQAYVFAIAMAISRNGIFMVIDFGFGVTRVWMIRYNGKGLFGLMPLAHFGFNGKQKSVISGYFMIVATVEGRVVILWEAISGKIHRRVEFANTVTQIVADEEVGFWVVTDHEIIFLGINGEHKCRITSPTTVTSLAALQLPADLKERIAIGGAGGGQLYLVRADPKEGFIEWKQFPSEHRAAVIAVLIHPSLKEFISVSKDGRASVWSAPGVVADLEERRIRVICATCHRTTGPLVFCTYCGRSFCEKCICADASPVACGVCFFRFDSFFF